MTLLNWSHWFSKLLGFEKVIFTLYRSSLSDSEVIKFAANGKEQFVRRNHAGAQSLFILPAP